MMPFERDRKVVFPADEPATCLECGVNTESGRAVYLCGPDHRPWDGNANYFCERCLDGDAEIETRSPVD